MKKITRILLFVLIVNIVFPITVFAQDKNNKTLIPNATSGVLMEATTGKILFEKEKNKKVSVASMTKMAAQIIILEEIEKGNIKWGDIVTVSKNAADMGGSQIYISEGEKISVEDLMKGISMASGNDATVAMAEYISGSEEKFVKRMNDRVKQLGLKNTNFKNCTGLDEEDHYSTAYDMAVIARELVVSHPEIFRFSSVYEDYLRQNTDNKFWLVNTNKLVRFYDGADGLKTGHTDDAGYCLAATAKKNNLRLIAIVLGEKESKVRNSETMSLLDYGFSNIKMNILKKSGTVVQQIKLEKATKDIIDLSLKEDLGVVEDLERGVHKYKYEVELDDIKLPLKAGSIIGTIIVKEDGKKVSSGDLIIKENVNPLSYLKLFYNGLKNIVSGQL